jgi:type II secretory pathway component PulC
VKKNIDAKNVVSAFILGFKKTIKRSSDAVTAQATVQGTVQREGRLFRLWSWILPLLLGGVFGWFGMVCLEVGLDGYVRRSRPAAASVTASGIQSPEAASMTAFLKNNPFKITPMVLPEPEEASADSPEQITGSLAAAVLRWTMPDTGVVLEDQGNQYVVLVNESFDVYTLEEVTYREAVFVKDENRVVKELLYSKEGPALPPPSAPVASNRAADLGPQVVPADPSNGAAGEINRDMINGLMENPFDELKKVRLRPAADEQGLQIQWINKDSILAQLGVQKGDVIRSINGIAFRNMMDITNSVSSLMNSDRFDVEVMRNGTPTSLQYVVR